MTQETIPQLTIRYPVHEDGPPVHYQPGATWPVCEEFSDSSTFNNYVRNARAEWLKPTLKAIAALPWEKDNWTSGGKRTQQAAVNGILTLLVRILDNVTPPPSVVPTWSGGVQVEWHRNNVDFEIEACPRGRIQYFFKSPTEECEGQAWDNLSKLVKYAQAVTVSE